MNLHEHINAKPKDVAPFDVVDPFNPENTISGIICRVSDHRYGALVIGSVNGEALPKPRVVYATPKLHYPFTQDLETGERRYSWPAVTQVIAYTKYDGTNILHYGYSDAQGNKFTTFKTRLTPVLQDGRYGGFLTMWREILVRYPGLRCPWPVFNQEEAFSYELCGYRNRIVVDYGFALDAVLLFRVKQCSAGVIPPDNLACSLTDMGRAGQPIPQPITTPSGLVDFYNRLRAEAHERNLLASPESDDADTPAGFLSEGFVLYAQTEGGQWEMFKCKPGEVEELHWAASGAIPAHSIYTTVRNSLESVAGPDEITYDGIIELLQEDFRDDQIAKSEARIRKTIDKVVAGERFKATVHDEIARSGLAGQDKRVVMRHMSQFFKKAKMRVVCRILLDAGYLS